MQTSLCSVLSRLCVTNWGYPEEEPLSPASMQLKSTVVKEGLKAATPRVPHSGTSFLQHRANSFYEQSVLRIRT